MVKQKIKIGLVLEYKQRLKNTKTENEYRKPDIKYEEYKIPNEYRTKFGNYNTTNIKNPFISELPLASKEDYENIKKEISKIMSGFKYTKDNESVPESVSEENDDLNKEILEMINKKSKEATLLIEIKEDIAPIDNKEIELESKEEEEEEFVYPIEKKSTRVKNKINYFENQLGQSKSEFSASESTVDLDYIKPRTIKNLESVDFLVLSFIINRLTHPILIQVLFQQVKRQISMFNLLMSINYPHI